MASYENDHHGRNREPGQARADRDLVLDLKPSRRCGCRRGRQRHRRRLWQHCCLTLPLLPRALLGRLQRCRLLPSPLLAVALLGRLARRYFLALPFFLLALLRGLGRRFIEPLLLGRELIAFLLTLALLRQ